MNRIGGPRHNAQRAIRNNVAQRHSQGHSGNYWFFIHYLIHNVGIGPKKLSAKQPTSQTDLMCRVEGVLFLAREPLTSRKVAQLAGLADATEARTLVRLLNQRYDQLGRAFRIEEVAGGFSILTRPQFAPWLRRLAYVPGETRLTQSAMETLAIVAYRQPVLRADIEVIRGMGCGEVLKQLMNKDLVRICGRSEELGRPYLYGTTRRFLQMFGLRSADRLPRADWINAVRSPSAENSQAILASTRNQEIGTGSDAKESTVNKSFSAAAILEQSYDTLEETLLKTHSVRAARDDEVDDDFIDEDEDEVDDDDDFDDDEDDLDDDDFDDEDDLDEEEDDLEDDFDDEDDEEWEEVDDEDDEEDDEEDEEWEEEDDDDWDDDDEEEEAEDEDWD